MVRVGGLQYTIDPLGAQGQRISDMRLKGTLIDASKNYKVAGWAPVAEAARDAALATKAEPIWDVVEGWLKSKKRVTARKLNMPKILNASGNKGMA